MTLAKIYVHFFFLALPFVGGYLPYVSRIEGMTGELVLLAVFPILLIQLALKARAGKAPQLIGSRIAFWFLLYNGYILLNGLIQQNEFRESVFLAPPLVLAFLLVIDNLTYTNRDFVLFKSILIVVAIGTFVVSAVQLTIDPLFYREVQVGIDPRPLWYGSDIHRNASIFTPLGFNEGGLAIGYLAIFFLFLPGHTTLTAMLFFSAYATFARHVWLMPLLGLTFYVIYRYRKGSQFILFSLAAAALLFIYFFYSDSISSSAIYQERITEDTSGSQIQSSILFFRQYFPARPVFGYGESSWYSDSFIADWGYEMGIHVGWFDLIYSGGLVGLFLYCGFVYQIYLKGRAIYRQTGNPIFLVCAAVFTLHNFVGIFTQISYYGYYFMLFYLFLYHKLDVASDDPVLAEGGEEQELL